MSFGTAVTSLILMRAIYKSSSVALFLAILLVAFIGTILAVAWQLAPWFAVLLGLLGMGIWLVLTLLDKLVDG